MHNSTLFIAGSIHQGHDCFSDLSRGRQCTFMSLSAFLCAQAWPIMQWNVETIDQILTEGDKMFLNALEKDLIPDSETISLRYLPDRARWHSTNKSTVIRVISQQTNVKSPLWIYLTLFFCLNLTVCTLM